MYSLRKKTPGCRGGIIKKKVNSEGILASRMSLSALSGDNGRNEDGAREHMAWTRAIVRNMSGEEE